jgi:hypothetical protein
MTAATSDLPGTPQPLVWSHGRAEIWPLGATIHHLEMRLPDGRLVRPLAEAPWHGDSDIIGDASIPAHLRHLGGEWPCVPFGSSAADPVTHGYGTDNRWRLLNGGRENSVWEIVYPADRPVERLRREIMGVHGHAAVDFTLTVTARRDCTLPIGLHPIVRLPDAGGTLRIEGSHAYGETFPVVFQPDVSRLAPGARFAGTRALPLAGGGDTTLSALAAEVTEEAFQLFGVDGDLRAVYPDDGYALQLSWQARDFPTCLFWLSAGGRTAKPWNGRFRGLGIEPLDARFESSGDVAAIVGGRRMRAGEVWTTRYRMAVEPA